MSDLIDILIPNHNTADLILSGIVGPLEQNIGREVHLIIVDDGSHPTDVEVLKTQLQVPAELCTNSSRRGFPETANRLLQLSTAPIRVLCNSDIIFPSFAELRRLVDILEGLPDNSILGTAEGPLFMDEKANPYTIHLHRGDPDPCPQDYVSACLMMTRRPTLTSTTEFSTIFSPGYYEDSDLCYRLRSDSWQTIYATSTVCHLQNQAIMRLEIEHINDEEHTPMHDVLDRSRALFMSRWRPYLSARQHNLYDALEQHHDTNARLRKDRPQW